MSLTKASFSMISGTPINVIDYGVTGDGQTDDLAGFNAALTAAKATGKSIYVPPTQYWYRITDTWVIDGDSITIYGEGVNSLFCIDNIAGKAAIQITGMMCLVDSIGITGVAGSGHGFEIKTTGPTAQGKFNNIWVGWVGGDCFRVTKGQSSVWTSCFAMQNNGYRPRGNFQPSLPIPRTEGTTQNAFHVCSEAGNNTNDQTFIGCSSNAGALTNGCYALKVGDGAGTRPQSVKWFGGLLQGSGYGEEFYLYCTESLISGAHIEAAAVSPVPYTGYMIGCRNVVIEKGILNGDVLMQSCTQSGFKNVFGCGLNVDGSNNSFIFWNEGYYGNISTGPAGGLIRDIYGVVTATGLYFAKDSTYCPTVNNAQITANAYLTTQFADWTAGVPDGFATAGGTGTLTKTAAFGRRTTGFVCEVLPSSGLSNVLTVALPSDLAGQNIYVEAWVYNQDQAGSFYLGINNPAQDFIQSFGVGVWERVCGTFIPPAGTVASTLVFTGLAGQKFYLDSVYVYVQGLPGVTP